ncbi:hypothetical protein DFH11DRAFT_1621855 [Phellopilus nigrolimitatus]|nr:hypothetical protein DFH11DRAFT_1621855 [Phellopilus nigrolimitatus]
MSSTSSSSSTPPGHSSPLPPVSSSSPLSPRHTVDAIKRLLGQTMRICASDGRIFIGTFVCVDKQKNIVLSNTDEYRVGGPAQGRYVTMVMVPWRLVVKVEVQSLSTGMVVARNGEDDEDLYT